MAQLTHHQYDQLERAIIDRRRIAVYRHGIEYVVIPQRLRTDGGREVIDAMRPTTGEVLPFYIDDLDDLEVV